MITPDVKIKGELECSSCGHEQELEVPFGADFLWPDGGDSEHVYETFFTLKHYGGWSLFELYNLPVGLRRWWLERTIKEYEKEKEEMDKAKR